MNASPNVDIDATLATNGPAPQLASIIRRTEERMKYYEGEAERERTVLVELRRLRELVARVDNPESSSMFNEQVVNDHASRNDFSSMPLCSERSLLVLLFYASQQVTDRCVVSPYRTVPPIPLEREIEKEFVHLKERLRLEEHESEAMDSLVKTAMMNARIRNWNSVVTTLKQILRRINPLDMQKLFRLVNEIDDTAHLLKGKDVILFLGETGVGKSTTIHFLSGSILVPTVIDGLNHLKPEPIKNPEARKILTSPASQSATRCVASVSINPREMGVFNKDSIVLCDTPGVGDTQGAEEDIANGVSIVRAIRECRSVKPVVVISYRGIGDRLSGLTSLSRALIRMMPNIQDHIRSFSYLFTKFPPNEKDKIPALLSEANRTIDDRDTLDPGFVALLQDMRRKTAKNRHTLDPLTDDPKELLYELTASPYIERLDEVFRPVSSERSIALVQEQVRKHQLTIIGATKRADYPLVKYKLDQLRRLDDLLGHECIKQSYTDSLRHLREHLSKEYHEATSSLHGYLSNHTILHHEEIRQYQTCIVHATVVEQLLESHLGKDLVPSERFVEYLHQEVDAIVNGLREKDIDDSSLKLGLGQLKLLSTSFPDLEAKYQQICEFFTKKLESLVKSWKSSIPSNKFDTIARDMTKLRGASTTLQEHLTRVSSEATYMHLEESFLQHLKDSVEKLTDLFNQTKLEQSDIDRLRSCVSMLESAKNTPDLHLHISKEEISRILEGLLSSIVHYFEKIRERVESDDTFRTAEEWVKMLEALRTISTLEHRTSRSYFCLWESIASYLNESARNAEELLKSVSRLEGSVIDEKLTKCLASLTSVQWIQKYRSGLYSNVMETVKKKLIVCVVEMKESVMKNSLGLDQYERIESAVRLVEKLEWLTQFETIASDLRQHSTEIHAWLETVTMNVLASIQETFHKEKWEKLAYRTIDWNRVEKSFRYLDACRNFRPLLSKSFTLLASALEAFVVDAHHFIAKEMKLSFDTIKQYPTKSKEEVLGEARLLCVRWQELSEIETAYPRVYASFPTKRSIERWQSELSTYLSDVTDELHLFSVTLQTKALLDKLVVLKVLSLFDRFLAGEKYMQVYAKYQEISFTQMRTTREQITEAIGNHDYEQMHEGMRRLELSGDVGEYFSGQARRALNVAVGNLLEETESRGLLLKTNLDVSEVNSLVKNLKRIQRAKQYLSNYLDRPSELDDCVKNVTTLIEDRIQHFLEKIKALISIHSFRQAEEDLASIGLIHRLLGHSCTKETSDHIRAMTDHPRQVWLHDVTERYAGMDISDYFLYPPIDIFSKLEEASGMDPIYHEALDTIRKRVVAKLMEELEKAKASDSSHIHLRRFETAVKYLPQTMKEALEVALKYCREDINPT